MPLLKTFPYGPDCRVALWQITESEADFHAAFPHMEQLKTTLSHYRNTRRRLEILAAHALLYALTNDESLAIGHADNGQPVVDGFQISVSHTEGFAAIILSKAQAVGIDIERRSDRVGRVAKRFIRPDEWTDDPTAQLILWSAKETVYKLRSNLSLEYFEMRALPFAVADEGTLRIEEHKAHTTMEVRFMLTNSYVLTFSS